MGPRCVALLPSVGQLVRTRVLARGARFDASTGRLGFAPLTRFRVRHVWSPTDGRGAGVGRTGQRATKKLDPRRRKKV
jgi:hypothetical protein